MTTLLPGETLAASLAEKVSETWQKINPPQSTRGDNAGLGFAVARA